MRLRLVWTVLVFSLATGALTATDGFDITTLAPDGTRLTRFRATLEDMHINSVKVGPDGNIWVCRSDNSHSRGVPNPNDMVVVFDAVGNELRTVDDTSMRDPVSVTWDSAESIYVSGEDDFFATNIYKYDPSGNFLYSFRTAGWGLIDIYNDLLVTPTDRLYASAWWGTGSADQMTEFDTSGTTINTFSPTGPSYFHRDMALMPSSFWVYTPKNGSGDDLMREFDFAGNQVDVFNVSTAVPGSLMHGLERGPTGTLFTLERSTAILYELDTDGNVVGQTALEGVAGWIRDFTFAQDGKILVANQTLFCPDEGTWSNYGAGWPGTNGIPSISALNDPGLCNTFGIEIGNSLGATTVGVLLLGAEDSISTGLGGTLLVNPISIFSLTLPAGGLTLSAVLPCDTGFCGAEINLQILEADPGASAGVSFTQGLKLNLGG